MEFEWQTTKLGKYIDSSLGKMLDKNKNKGEYKPYLGNINVRWGSFELNDLSRMKFEPHESERYGIKKGDLIICEGGEPGRCAIWEEDIPEMKIQKALHRVRPLSGLLVEYLYYWFLYAGKNGLLEPYFTGTTIKHLTGKALAELPIKIPPLHYQQQGSSILRKLDKKINLNTQINQTLEQMAQALFKSWFVDFDPVIDNALDAGNPIPEPLVERAARRKAMWAAGSEKAPARLPAETRRLFPDRFEEDEVLGWVPKGWGSKPVGDVVEIVGGGTPKTSTPEFWEGGHHAFCTPKDMSNLDSKILLQTERHLTNAGARKVSSGQLPVGTVLMSSRAPIGYLAIGKIPVSINQGIIALKPHGIFGSEFLLFWLDANRDQVESRANGSTFLEISKKNFRNIPFLIPPEDVCTEFAKQAKSYMNASTSFKEQMVSLTKLRDTLLPKLLSGELQLPEAEAAVDTALETEFA